LADFENNDNQKAILADHLVKPEPMVARLTIYFSASLHPQTRTAERGPIMNSFSSGATGPDNPVRGFVLRRIPLDVLPALRDAEGDLANWRKSPLKPLLDETAGQIQRETLTTIAKQGVRGNTSGYHYRRDASTRNTDNGKTPNDGRVIPCRGNDAWFRTHRRRTVCSEHCAFLLMADGGELERQSLGLRKPPLFGAQSLELELSVKQGARDHTFLAI